MSGIQLDQLYEITGQRLLGNPLGSSDSVDLIQLNDTLEFDGSNKLGVNTSAYSFGGFKPIALNDLTGNLETVTDTQLFTFLNIVNAQADSSTKGLATFASADFNDNGAGLISLDYTNGQKATTTLPGFLSSTDWNTFNNKVGGSGTTNYIPKFTGSATLGDSLINQVSSKIGINVASPQYLLDVNGPFNVNGVQTFQTNDTVIQHGATFGNTIVGNANNSIGATSLRAVIIGDNNSLSAVSTLPFNIAIGYANLVSLNTYGYILGTFNTITSSGTNYIVTGESNTITASLGFGILMGNSITLNDSTSSGTIAIGTNLSISHHQTATMGYGVSTTADHQFIMASQQNTTSDGFNDIYGGTGPVRMTGGNTTDYMNDLTYHGSGAANVADKDGGNLRSAGGKGTGTGNGGHFYIATTDKAVSGTTRQTLVDRVIVEHNTGFMGIATMSPTSFVDILGTNGYDQLRLRTAYTPSSSADANGDIGDVCWDQDYWYWKTLSNGWLRVAGATF